ncbi:hypothetical protein SDJN02_17984, partial [Cucurbita argyrosperma subsp. argyrosperma]
SDGDNNFEKESERVKNGEDNSNGVLLYRRIGSPDFIAPASLSPSSTLRPKYFDCTLQCNFSSLFVLFVNYCAFFPQAAPQSQYFGLKASELVRGEGCNIGMTGADHGVDWYDIVTWFGHLGIAVEDVRSSS